MRLYTQSEGTAARRRFPLYLVDATDGLTPETGETGGQPQISKGGGAWVNTTATLTAVGNGYYYVELTATELDTLGIISVRYKSANTAEANMDGQVVVFNIYDAVRLGLTALPNAAADAAGGLPISDAGALDLDAKLAATNEITAARMGALTDWIDGGRLDLILDSVLDDTGTAGVVVAAGSKTGYTLTATTGLGNQTADITGSLSGSVGSITNLTIAASTTLATGTHNPQTGDTYVLANGAAGFVAIDAKLPAALVGGRIDANASAIGGDATAATNLSKSALGIVPGACEGAPSTTVIQTDLAEATDDHYIGRIVVFTSGAAAGEASDITDYTGATGTITVTALTTAPAAADTFVII